MSFRLILSMALLLAASRTGSPYHRVDVGGGREVLLKWAQNDMPVPWYFNKTSPKGFSLDAAIDATQASYDTWESVETSGITFRFAGTTNAEPFVFFDFINTLGFIAEPEFDFDTTGVLAATSWTWFANGDIAESDIFFNDDVPWSVAPNGRAGHFDYQSTATHEIGHFLGLGHSGVGVMETSGGRRSLLDGSAILFPFAFPRGSTVGRTLTVDDVTGASVIYPAGNFARDTATMSGRVTKNGEGLASAHLTTYNPFTDELIGIFTDENGDYRVEGLASGPIEVRVNPITDPASPSDFDFSDSRTDLDFQVTFHEGRAEVTAGRNTPGIDVAVTP